MSPLIYCSGFGRAESRYFWRMRIWLLIFVMITVVACSKEDNEAPLIARVTVNQSESFTWFEEAGELVTVEITATDNRELNQYRVAVVVVGDNLLPTGTLSDSLKVVGEWEVTRIGELKGETDQVSLQFSIPQEVAGERYVVVEVLDEAGNLSEKAVRRLMISNDFIPDLNVDLESAGHDGFLAISAANDYQFSGVISDADGLQSVGVDLFNASGNLVWFVRYATHGAESIDLATLPISFGSAPLGVYTLSFVATDSQGFENCEQTACVVF